MWFALCICQFAFLVALFITTGWPLGRYEHGILPLAAASSKNDVATHASTLTPGSRVQIGASAPTFEPAKAVVEYKDFVSVLLTAIGVMIAVLAAIFAIAAIWGWGTLERQVVTAAADRAEKEARDVMSAALKRAEEIALAEAERVATIVATTLIDQKSTGNDSGDYGLAAGRNQE